MLIPFCAISILNGFIGIKLMGLFTPLAKLQKSLMKKNSSHDSSEILSTRLKILNNKLEYSTCKRHSYSSMTQNIESEATSSNFVPILGISNITERKKKYSKTTKLLLCISSAYLILHTPLALSKIYYFLKNQNIYNQNYEAQESFDQSTISINLELISNSSLDFERLNTTYFFNMSTDIEINLWEEIIERIGGYLYYLNFPLNFFLYTLNGKKFRDGIKHMFKRKHILKRRWCVRV